MYSWQTIIILLGAVMFYAYLFFKRQTKNFFMNLISKWKKRYVVVHLRFTNGKIEEHNVVPDKSGLTKVENNSYLLKPEFAILRVKGRLHFLIDEQNSQPIQEKEQELIFVASEIQTALDNKIMELLFSTAKNIMMIILIILALVAVITIVYNIYSLQNMKELLQSISRIEVHT